MSLFKLRSSTITEERNLLQTGRVVLQFLNDITQTDVDTVCLVANIVGYQCEQITIRSAPCVRCENRLGRCIPMDRLNGISLI